MRNVFVIFLVLLTAFSAAPVHAKEKKQKAKQHPNYERYVNDDEYRSGRSTRLAGILVASIGGGVGGGILVGGLLWNMCVGATSKQKPECRRNANRAMATGLVVTGASLGVGIPLITVGAEKMDDARRRIDDDFPVKGADQELSLAVRVLNLTF